MTPILLALALASSAPCAGDGHNAHRSKTEIQKFKKTTPCPSECATFIKTSTGYVLYQKCGRCQVDHICPLACCGADKASNMQWLTAEQNGAKSDHNCSLYCK